MAGPTTSGFRRALLVVFLVALAVRVLHVSRVERSPFARLLVGDARSYDAWAQRIAAGDGAGTGTFYQAPLYPYALAALYRTVGRDPMTVRWTQAALGAAACVLLALAGRFWLGASEGIVAGSILALYPPAIFFDGLIQKAALDGFFVCALLALLGAYAAREGRAVLLAAGAATGALALTRENALVFAVIVAAWLAVRATQERAKSVGIYVAGLALVLLPVGLRNLAVGGEFTLTTSQSGPNFYMGNHEGATGHYVPLKPGREMPEFERVDATDIAQRAMGRPLTPREVSAYWWRSSLAWMRQEPGAWLALLGHKVLLTWNRIELPDTESFAVYAEYSFVLRVLGAVLGFGVVAPLGIAGIFLAVKRRGAPLLLVAMLLGFSAAVAIFYVFARYRFPMVPLLILFAAHALVVAWDRVRSGNARALLPVAAVAALAAIVVNWPLESMAGERGRSFVNLGIALATEGKLDQAVAAYRRGIEDAPDDPLAYANLGAALAAQGRTQDAGDALVTALRLDPAMPEAHRSLAMLLAQRGDFAGAERHFREIVARDPGALRDRTDLGNAILEQGRTDEAIATYREVLSRDPRFLDARLNLANALLRAGRRDDAIAEVREAARLDPGSADARQALEQLVQEP
ncbi:MAG TPA: tetratricopeptide repeat protein [Candidatus Bathyarchaeia archaeon]|nr:tetratricopeptide repeat protein [Candidatus Bathyarchaeia archaeon]